MNVHILQPPRTIDELGVPESLVSRLVLKFMFVQGLSTVSELAAELKVSQSIINNLLDHAQKMALVEVLGQRDHGIAAEMTYALTKKGQDFAQESLDQSQYLGPVPVSLEAFGHQVNAQSVHNEHVTLADLMKSFSDMIMPEEMIDHLGPAVKSARTLLLYGPPGNGKSCISAAIINAFQHTIFVPYAIEVDNQIIKVYDTTVHTRVGQAEDEDAANRGPRLRIGAVTDPRWVNCERPIIITGGELTLDMLDLMFDPHSKFYEAPMQLKATGGVFVVDDFGRQRVDPRLVLNRWIVPLEGRIDYLTLHTGKKFQVPFDELVIFSTNMTPSELLDGATSRRIHYKMEVGAPTRKDYLTIMNIECDKRNLVLTDDVISYLFDEVYADGKIPLARYHPKFICDQVTAFCAFREIEPTLNRKLVKLALSNLYAD